MISASGFGEQFHLAPPRHTQLWCARSAEDATTTAVGRSDQQPLAAIFHGKL